MVVMEIVKEKAGNVADLSPGVLIHDQMVACCYGDAILTKMDHRTARGDAIVGVVMRNDPVEENHHPGDQERQGLYLEVSSQYSVCPVKIIKM
jgi:hypothetical protein